LWWKILFLYKRRAIRKNKNKPQIEIPEQEKEIMEKEIREISGIVEEDTPVILDLESIRAVAPGKYEIDVVNLFNKKDH
jgi:predicted  nucleic acid-binding Zn-ribbon protein